MSCFINGQPAGNGNLTERIYLNSLTVNGLGQSISIQQKMTRDVVMEQLTVHWASPLTTPEFITLSKVNTTTPAYSTILIRFDPFTDGILDWWNITPFRWRAGDTVYLVYPNTDNIGIGAEIILRTV